NDARPAAIDIERPTAASLVRRSDVERDCTTANGSIPAVRSFLRNEGDNPRDIRGALPGGTPPARTPCPPTPLRVARGTRGPLRLFPQLARESLDGRTFADF